MKEREKYKGQKMRTQMDKGKEECPGPTWGLHKTRHYIYTAGLWYWTTSNKNNIDEFKGQSTSAMLLYIHKLRWIRVHVPYTHQHAVWTFLHARATTRATVSRVSPETTTTTSTDAGKIPTTYSASATKNKQTKTRTQATSYLYRQTWLPASL